MSANLKSALPFLRALAKIKDSKSRKTALNEVSGETKIQKALREIAKNVVRRKLKLTKKHLAGLVRHKRTISSLTKKKLSQPKKKNLVVQSGGFLPILIPLVASILGEVIKAK